MVYDIIKVYMPSVYNDLYNEVKNIPFYKVDNGYQYASHLLENEESAPTAFSFLQGENMDDQDKEFMDIFKGAVKELSELIISDEAFTFWSTFKKEREGVERYHKILDNLYEQILLVGFKRYVKIDEEREDIVEENGTVQLRKYMNKHEQSFDLPCQDEAAKWKSVEDSMRVHSGGSSGKVLNHNNPFADISIHEQQFIFGSIMNQFESLSLTTSHTVTKQDKDTEKSYMVLQPGFKIKKDKSLSKTAKQDIVFDDTLTSELANNDTNIYVYID